MHLTQALVELASRVSALERGRAGAMRHGTVAEVDPAEGWVRLDLGPADEGRLLSPRIPYAQTAGALRIHAPPSVGQQMTVFAPTGDMMQGVAMPLTWSDAVASPGDGADVALTFGGVRIDLRDDGLTLSIGGVTIAITGAGLSVSGGRVEHDGLNIGSSHTHGGILPGIADTLPPNP
jgi:phage baseplate assembly protein gpV